MTIQELIEYRCALLDMLLSKTKEYVYFDYEKRIIYPASTTLSLDEERAILNEMRRVTTYIGKKKTTKDGLPE